VLTLAFNETVQVRLQQDAAFCSALLSESVDALLAGDLDAGKAVMRDYIKATIGFERLATASGTPPKSLIRIVSPAGNLNARTLFVVLGELPRQSGIQLHRRSVPAALR
jgi:hypothetical protein